MKISKTQFMNIMRCDRYAALNEIYQEKDDAIVSFSDNLELEDLMGLENQQKRKEIQLQMYDESTDEDLIESINEQTEMMLPFYNKLEMLSGKAIRDRFGGNIIYDMDTFNQKRFTYNKDGFNFYCFLDGYQEDKEHIRIFETKSTTSKKFLDDFTYKCDETKERLTFFTQLPSGIYYPREDIEKNLSADYYKKRDKLYDRLDKIGRYIYDIAYQGYVFSKTYKTTKNVEYYLILLNHEYIHDGNEDENGNPIYPNDIVKFFNLTTIVNQMIEILEDHTNLVINRLDRMDAREVKLGKHCQRNDSRQCPFFDICYDKLPEKNSIFAYMGYHHGFRDGNDKYELYDLINEGYYSALDIPKEWLNRTNNQIQREVMETKEPYYDYDKIKDGIAQLKYPIYHLDFESFNAPLPRFKGEKPYTQSVFQFSVHIEHEPGVCDKDKDHYEFLATDHSDQRRELVEKLLDVIKDDGGTVLTYNVSFERGRLKEFQEYFPEYSERLQDIIDRCYDLMYIVKTNGNLYKKLGYSDEVAKMVNFYHNDLNGSYSIKKVLPIFSDLSYDGMRVGNGTEAMVAYSKFPVLKGREYEETYNDLVNYCKQDTWAMFEILKELRKI